ncbi:hypothetical protein M758_3G009900 [Ceratodon purpureus]|nr:hypothetical protein M758_3G009900 [Ceratodon purpureus]
MLCFSQPSPATSATPPAQPPQRTTTPSPTRRRRERACRQRQHRLLPVQAQHRADLTHHLIYCSLYNYRRLLQAEERKRNDDAISIATMIVNKMGGCADLMHPISQFRH